MASPPPYSMFQALLRFRGFRTLPRASGARAWALCPRPCAFRGWGNHVVPCRTTRWAITPGFDQSDLEHPRAQRFQFGLMDIKRSTGVWLGSECAFRSSPGGRLVPLEPRFRRYPPSGRQAAKDGNTHLMCWCLPCTMADFIEAPMEPIIDKLPPHLRRLSEAPRMNGFGQFLQILRTGMHPHLVGDFRSRGQRRCQNLKTLSGEMPMRDKFEVSWSLPRCGSGPTSIEANLNVLPMVMGRRLSFLWGIQSEPILGVDQATRDENPKAAAATGTGCRAWRISTTTIRVFSMRSSRIMPPRSCATGRQLCQLEDRAGHRAA